MQKMIRALYLLVSLSLVSACTVETYPNPHKLRITISSDCYYYSGWAATVSAVLGYRQSYCIKDDITDYHDYYFGGGEPSIDEISWVIWELSGINSISTGTLSFQEIAHQIDADNPIIVRYKGYNEGVYGGHFAVIYGYDDNGYVYLDDPDYGTRVIYYDNMFTLNLYQQTHYWASSLIIKH